MFGGLAICLLLLGVFSPPDPDGGELNLGLAAGAIFGAISLRYTLLALDPDRQDLERGSLIGIAFDVLQGAGALVALVLGWIWLTRYVRGQVGPLREMEGFGLLLLALLAALYIVRLAVKLVRRAAAPPAKR